jgi:Tfp pilus assembly protein PilF
MNDHKPYTQTKANPSPSIEQQIHTLLSLCIQQKYQECIAYARSHNLHTIKHSKCIFTIAFAFQQLHQYQEAIKFYQLTIRIDPQFMDAYKQLGQIFSHTNQFHNAIQSYKTVLKKDPTQIQYYSIVGDLLKTRLKYQEAEKYYKKAIRYSPKNHALYINLGIIQSNLQDWDSALSNFRKAQMLKPDFVESLGYISTMLIRKGEIKKAKFFLNRLVQFEPQNGPAHYNLAKISKFTPDDIPIIEQMEHAIHQTDPPQDSYIAMAFALGKAFDDLQKPDQAFHYWSLGNTTKRKTIQYSIQNDEKIFHAIQRIFTPKLIQRFQDIGCKSQIPLFIVGMPRSGTSLIEQILASHPNVFGAGELFIIENMTLNLHRTLQCKIPYPHCMGEIDKETIQLMGNTYLNRIRKYSHSSQYIIDKLPQNFIHIGFISLLFPNAKIIHCRRNPKDTCLSCYSNCFEKQNLPYTYTLKELGQFYRLYLDYMKFWKQILPSRIYDIEYEEVTQDFETSIRNLFQYCNLEWDKKYMQFHQTKRIVKTASDIQVKTPLYTKSVDRWKNYSKYLDDLGFDNNTVSEKLFTSPLLI